ncbi:glutamate synthase subunit beta [Thiohalorhabdus sp.]|uniref:glutamate synthase subunit beta n=1 Tax=Thiohalorhabdus sp. TaxID=3094134 RepID=UPI002FC3727A
MGQIDGFIKFPRHGAVARPPEVRRGDFRELYQEQTDSELAEQGARCMDCGIPYCQTDTGCPVDNLIPEWNDLVYHGQWYEALGRLHETNNFPEFTGWLCPAPCESACTLDLVENAPVTIKNIERNIIERGFDEGWVEPVAPAPDTGLSVAVVGSGPAGLAAAQQMARWGHAVTVLEKADRIGGLLRYGIPDFKMAKFRIDRRMEQMEAEGVTLRTGVNVGEDITAEELRARYDAVILSGGAEVPRDHDVPGRDLEGVHYAMPFLTQQNRINAGDSIAEDERISAEGKHVVIIGGGDTGADCVGTSIRQGAASVNQINIHPEPPEERSDKTPWPEWPYKRMDSTSHDEGCERLWKVYIKTFEGDESGHVRKAHAVKVKSAQRRPDGSRELIEEPDGDFVLDADLVLLAIGFAGPHTNPLLEGLGVELDKRGNATADPATRMTSVPGVFSAGDMYRGASLIVWAIQDGREAAEGAHRYLMKQRVAQRLKVTAD